MRKQSLHSYLVTLTSEQACHPRGHHAPHRKQGWQLPAAESVKRCVEQQVSGSREQRKRDAETWRSTHSISSLWREVSISRVRQQREELNSLDSVLCIIVTLAE